MTGQRKQFSEKKHSTRPNEALRKLGAAKTSDKEKEEGDRPSVGLGFAEEGVQRGRQGGCWEQ